MLIIVLYLANHITSYSYYLLQQAYSVATGNLLELLAENGRLNKLDHIINSFKIIMSAHRGEVICEVKTAKALDEAQRKNLEGALKVFYL